MTAGRLGASRAPRDFAPTGASPPELPFGDNGWLYVSYQHDFFCNQFGLGFELMTRSDVLAAFQDAARASWKCFPPLL